MSSGSLRLGSLKCHQHCCQFVMFEAGDCRQRDRQDAIKSRHVVLVLVRVTAIGAIEGAEGERRPEDRDGAAKVEARVSHAASPRTRMTIARSRALLANRPTTRPSKPLEWINATAQSASLVRSTRADAR